MSVYDRRGTPSPNKAGITRPSSAPESLNVSKGQEHPSRLTQEAATARLTQEAATGGGRRPAAVHERIRVYSEALSAVVHVATDDADVTGWEGEIVYRQSDLPLLEGLSRDQLRAVHAGISPLPALRLERRPARQIEVDDASVGPIDIDEDVSGWSWDEHPAGWDDPLTEAALGVDFFPFPRVAGYERVGVRRDRLDRHNRGRQAYAAAVLQRAEMAAGTLRRLRDRLLTLGPDWESQILLPEYPMYYHWTVQARASADSPVVHLRATMECGAEEHIKRGPFRDAGFHDPPYPPMDFEHRYLWIGARGDACPPVRVPAGRTVDAAVAGALLGIVANQARRLSDPTPPRRGL